MTIQRESIRKGRERERQRGGGGLIITNKVS